MENKLPNRETTKADKRRRRGQKPVLEETPPRVGLKSLDSPEIKKKLDLKALTKKIVNKISSLMED